MGRRLLLIVIALGPPVPLGAQQSTPQIPVILGLPASARFSGLGGASVAVNGDAGSVFSNPTGLATMKHAAVEGAFQYFPDGSYEVMGSGAARLLQFNVGGGFHYLRFTDTSAVKDNLQWIGSGVYRFGLIAIGASVKYVSLEDSTGLIQRSLTEDAGIQLAFFDIMALAVAVQNIGNSTLSGTGLDLPTSTHVGLSFNFVDPQETARLLATVEAVWTERNPTRVLFGVEGGVVIHGVGIVARGGLGPQAPGTGLAGGAFGAGLVLGRLRFDYSYQKSNIKGSSLQGLGLRFTL